MSDTTKVKNGFYRSSYGRTKSPKLILVFSGEFIKYEKRGSVTSGWEGMVYKYYDFDEQKVYEFNNYWDNYIEQLIPANLTKAEIKNIKENFQEEFEALECELNEKKVLIAACE